MTLIEVMMASSILLVVLIALATVLAGSITSSQSAKSRDEATNLANARIEAARSLTYDQVGVHYANGAYGDPAGSILTPETIGRYTVVTDCSWVRDSSGRSTYKKLVVRVSWTQPSPGQIEVTTMLYGKSALATAGDLAVRLHYSEDAAPVTNGTVSIVTAGGTGLTLGTDSAGEAFFGRIGIGAVSVTIIPPAGCVVDTSRMSPASVAADQLTTLDVYVQKQTTNATVHVTDTTGAAVSGASVSLLRATDGAIIPTATTNASGDVVFSSLFYSNYTAMVSKSGCTSSTQAFTVSVATPRPTVPVSVTKLVGVGLRVRVFDVNGTQIPGGTISLKHHGWGGVLQQGTAGSNGEYTFTTFDWGSYDVIVDKTAYVSQTQQVWLNDGDNKILDFHLTPAVTYGTLSITTKDKNGHLRSIAVTVSGPYPTTGTSNSDGLLVLTLITGSYQVRCSSEPVSANVPVIISSGQTTPVTVSQTK